MNLIDQYLEEIQMKKKFIVIPITIGAYKIYQKYFSKVAKKCKNYIPKQECILMYKLKAKKEQLKKISNIKHLCLKDKNPNKCKKYATKQIEKIKSDIKTITLKIKELKKNNKK